MPVLKVLINAKGEVVGTARTDVGGSGIGAPQRATVVARPGQQLVEVTVSHKVANLDPGALHAAIKVGPHRPKS
jgi:hypothetical protein